MITRYIIEHCVCLKCCETHFIAKSVFVTSCQKNNTIDFFCVLKNTAFYILLYQSYLRHFDRYQMVTTFLERVGCFFLTFWLQNRYRYEILMKKDYVI
jgi:hypothetical protein